MGPVNHDSSSEVRRKNALFDLTFLRERMGGGEGEHLTVFIIFPVVSAVLHYMQRVL